MKERITAMGKRREEVLYLGGLRPALRYVAFLLLYILWTLEVIFPFHFPEFSLIFVVLNSFSVSPPLAAFFGFFLGFLSDHLQPVLFGRWTLFFTLLAFFLSYFKSYIIFSYPYLFLLVFISLFLKGVIGGFHWFKFLLTIGFVIPAIRVWRRWAKRGMVG